MDTVPRRINLTIDEVDIMSEASFGFVFRFRLFVAMAPSQVNARVPSVVAFVSRSASPIKFRKRPAPKSKSEARHAATWVDARRPRVAAADAAAAAGAEDAAEARTAAGDVSDGAVAAAAADGVRHRIAEMDSTVPRTRAISWL
jgi:hypothetical protein